jgi:hypothetical protein
VRLAIESGIDPLKLLCDMSKKTNCVSSQLSMELIR